MKHSEDQIKEMDLDEAKRLISRSVYEATRLIEDLEIKGKIGFNGHHVRQRLAQEASDTVEHLWREK